MRNQLVRCRKCGTPVVYLSPGISNGEDHYKCPKCGLVQVVEAVLV